MRYLKKAMNFIPYVAILFAVLYILRLESSFNFEEINTIMLIYSFILLFLVFIIRGLIWHLFLLRFKTKIEKNLSMVSQFRITLTKYIPGKLWTMLGKSQFLANYGYNFQKMTLLGLLQQVVMILTGLLVGFVGIICFNFQYFSNQVVIIGIALSILPLLILIRPIVIPDLKNIRFVPKRFKILGNQKIPPILDITILSIGQWILMGYAYNVLFKSLGYNLGILPVLLQPLANNIGIISFFAPGGLGVQEAVMIAYLSIAGLKVSTATSLSVLARLWFIIIEVLVFGLSFFMEKRIINNTLFIKK